MLREVTVKIRLERIDTYKGVIIEILLDSGMMRLVMRLEFTRKQDFILKKIEKLIYVRNIDSFFNKEEPIEYIVEVNIYYQEHRERIEIDVISGQKWSVILEISQLAYQNPEIDCRAGEVKMMRCPEKYGKQWSVNKR